MKLSNLFLLAAMVTVAHSSFTINIVNKSGRTWYSGIIAIPSGSTVFVAQTPVAGLPITVSPHHNLYNTAELGKSDYFIKYTNDPVFWNAVNCLNVINAAINLATAGYSSWKNDCMNANYYDISVRQGGYVWPIMRYFPIAYVEILSGGYINIVFANGGSKIYPN
jgi:hypothetical protein